MAISKKRNNQVKSSEAAPAEALVIQQEAPEAVEQPKAENAAPAEALVIPDSRDDWELFTQIAAAVGGDPETGNFRGSIRTSEPELEIVDATAVRYYRVIKLFCKTATSTLRSRKGGGFTISISAGERKVEAVEPAPAEVAEAVVEVAEAVAA
ncbi:MAG: hypothetical protein WCA35_09915 [Kovacikia sp.]